MNFYFIKQKSKPIMILKSPIQYKISKHLITKHKNPFILKINIPYKSEFMNIFDCIWIYKYFYIYKNYLFLSNPLVNISTLKIQFTFVASNLFQY